MSSPLCYGVELIVAEAEVAIFGQNTLGVFRVDSKRRSNSGGVQKGKIGSGI